MDVVHTYLHLSCVVRESFVVLSQDATPPIKLYRFTVRDIYISCGVGAATAGMNSKFYIRSGRGASDRQIGRWALRLAFVRNRGLHILKSY